MDPAIARRSATSRRSAGAHRCAVVGYDGSDEGRAALTWALQHVGPQGSVVAVGVLGHEPTPVPGGGAVARVATRMDRDDRRLWAAWDADVEALDEQVELVVERGRPSSVLLRIAAERDADVIVLGHRRHRATAASVLRDVLDASDRPVVVVP